MSGRLLLVGVSTRAAAESAARAGFTVTAIDAFGDLDQHQAVRGLSMGRDFDASFTPGAVARAAASLPCDAVAYLSNFENHPRAVSKLAAGRELWGNSPAVLRRVRDPRQLRDALAEGGFPTPRVLVGLEPSSGTRYVMKPVASRGGHRVRDWQAGMAVPRRSYLQEFVDGMPASIVFVAAGGRGVPLGLSRQLVGEAALGSAGYRYCGSILAGAGDGQFDRDEELTARACRLASVVTAAFSLVGVNGIDFVARGGVPYVVEVNPRWSASMELVERACGLSVFGVHADACRSGILPEFDLASARKGLAAVGKAIVFARREVVVGDTRQWLGDSTIRDVPQPGERIRAGGPVCTVFAEAPDAAGCHAALAAQAKRVYERLATWGRSVA